MRTGDDPKAIQIYFHLLPLLLYFLSNIDWQDKVLVIPKDSAQALRQPNSQVVLNEICYLETEEDKPGQRPAFDFLLLLSQDPKREW